MARAVLTGNGSVEERVDSLINGGFSIAGHGTWGGGTLTFTLTVDGTNYDSVRIEQYADGTFITSATANFCGFGNAVGVKSIKATLSGSTNPNLDVSVTAKPA